MEIIICSDKNQASVLVAKYIEKMMKDSLCTVIGCATGSTPEKVYQELIECHQNNSLSFKSVLTFNLDEYVGVPSEHPSSFRHYMDEKFFKHIDIPEKNVHFPDGMAEDVEENCQQYEKAIKHCGGIDVQLLGVGRDGHIAFNEPSSSLASRTRIKTLTKTTLKDNEKYFEGLEKYPKHAITMGIGTIMEAKECLLMAFGPEKSTVVSQLVEGPVSAICPASVLQMHPKTKVFLDQEAAEKLKHKAYYQEVFENKPQWQAWC
jgi:glucosamine-6-phosphate deaminase